MSEPVLLDGWNVSLVFGRANVVGMRKGPPHWRRWLLLPAIVLTLPACDQNLEGASFNALFYYPGGREVPLGRVEGLSSCQRAAGAYAANNNVEGGDWSYICCLRTSSSECASKHK